ncbi:MAG: tRNA (adenosine(37)-N6)-threonylcarbamoyltransferase complex transferase subunit TsaD [Pseudomonadota bacterium]
MRVLGVETSCDETAVAIVEHRDGEAPRILSSLVRSQDEHALYGGVVPEIAARAHVDVLDRMVAGALEDSGAALDDLDGIAATAGPGLIGGLIVGLTTAKALALGAGKPFVAVNHLEGHALTVGLTDDLRPPYLLLLVSGGHTQTVAVLDVGDYRRIGTTVDDALGEAFDKVAKLLNLGYPGGPAVERAARMGDPKRFSLPRPMVGRAEPNFSFSGLKTAVRLAAEAAAPLADQDVADLCASFQAAIADALVDRTARAIALFAEEAGAEPPALVVAGGVAANTEIRTRLGALADAKAMRFVVPPVSLCGDNAAMIAWAGLQRLRRGDTHGLDASPRARWPLDEARAKAGAKA